ncbi:hypothetical protein [Paracoccus sulfuroxidans]|uniref:Tail length tape measure protein n=1 Tax=Paracoccus sulfuroxidans TaxID=384678 RepID=A0A562NC26_9RHOB|nr:hypothetical protein [Paracoccus sulfuroxidans]TWI29742.1 hypothetical protein IQ24_03559 [Paracoccus sulfuroxidans]
MAEPDLVIEAGFSDARLVREVNQVVAKFRKAGEDAQKAFVDAQGKVTDTQAVAAHMRELDKLKKAYDPVYAAAKKYEDQVKRLDRALDVGAISQQQYTAAVVQAAAKFKGLDDATERVGRSAGSMRGQIQNVSFQIQDFAVQVAAGTAASTALGQQLPQLLGGLGALGAVIGAVVAVGVPLAASFMSTGDAAKELQTNLDELEKAVSAYNAAASDSGASAQDLAAKFGTATAAAQGLFDRMARLQYIDAVAAVDGAIVSLSKNFNDIQSYLNILDSELQQFGMVSPGTEENIAIQMKEQFGLAVDEAREFTRLMTDAQSTQNVAEKARLMDQISRLLYDSVQRSGEATKEQRNMAQAATEAAAKSYELAKSSEQLSISMEEAGDAASRIAANVAGIDFSNAIAGASALVSALTSAMAAVASLEGRQAQAMRRAEIAKEFAGDNVGKAGALAGVDFDSTFDAASGGMQGPLTKAAQEDVNARREVYVQGAKDIARIEEETQTKLKAIASAGGSGGGGGRKRGGGGGAAMREEPGLFDNAEKQLADLQRQIDLLGKGTLETAKLRAEWAMLDEAKRRGIPINDELSARIRSQAEAVGRLTSELEQGQLAQDQFDQAIDGIANAFSNAILQGESLRDSMAGIFRQIAANILNAGIQQALMSAFGGAGGGGFWGKLLSSAFGGTKAATPSFDGGGFTGRGSRSGGIDGKGGFPAILHPNETVLDHTRGQSMSGGGNNMNMTIDLRGTTGDRELDRKIAAAGRQILSQVPATMDDYQRRVR